MREDSTDDIVCVEREMYENARGLMAEESKDRQHAPFDETEITWQFGFLFPA